jgi:hypothetical protein
MVVWKLVITYAVHQTVLTVLQMILKFAIVVLEDASCNVGGMLAVHCKKLFLSLAKVCGLLLYVLSLT